MPSDSLIHAVAGSLGGVVAMTATYPLIFLSTRAAVDVEVRKDKKTIYEAVMDIVTREGVTGLYDGLTSSLIGIALTNGVYYYFYERSRGILLKSRAGTKALSTPETMLMGLIAGTATSIITNPVWVIQTSQTVRTLPGSSGSRPVTPSTEVSDPSKVIVKKLGFFETIDHILHKEGIKAFWRGIGPALFLVINPVLQYTVFEQLKNLMVKQKTARLWRAGDKTSGVAVLTDWDFFLLGALSKLVATSITYPYIVIKSRLQAGSASAARYKSTLDGIMTVIHEEGVEGLYKGVGSKLMQSVLTAAILFAGQRRFYEIVKKTIAKS